MTQRACNTCQWWSGRAENVLWGECHGAPPTQGPAGRQWPVTMADDYCAVYRTDETLIASGRANPEEVLKRFREPEKRAQ